MKTAKSVLPYFDGAKRPGKAKYSFFDKRTGATPAVKVEGIIPIEKISRNLSLPGKTNAGMLQLYAGIERILACRQDTLVGFELSMASIPSAGSRELRLSKSKDKVLATLSIFEKPAHVEISWFLKLDAKHYTGTVSPDLATYFNVEKAVYSIFNGIAAHKCAEVAVTTWEPSG